MRCRPSGPCPARIMIVGEAPGEQEEMLGQPFIGKSGSELKRMLKQAGINPSECNLTNVFMDRPANNDLDNFCGKRGEVGKEYSLPPLSTGKYIRPEYLVELGRLADEIRACQPDLIIAVGNTPCWALLQRTGIGKLRGNIFPCELVQGVSVLPTYHPAAILRDWSLRTIAIADLMKARRFVEEGFNVPVRELWLEPTMGEVRDFLSQRIFGDRPKVLSFDIETARETITCIGFSPSPACAITIPFYDPAKDDRCYWSRSEEGEVWELVREVCESDIPKLGQNGLYDIQYLYRHGIKVRAYLEDTMIRHHSLYPEMPKGLGFMGSIYTDEAAWKLLRDRNRDNFKLGDEND